MLVAAASAAPAPRPLAVDGGPPMRFYLGTHRPPWMTLLDVPLFISLTTIGDYRTSDWIHPDGIRCPEPGRPFRNPDLWPTRRPRHFKGPGIWALDSGAYTANDPKTGGNPDHPWHLMPDEFGGRVTSVINDVGIPPQFVPPQDWPCEPPVRELVTGFTVAIHQELTLDSYVYLAEQFAHVPWIPVLQGWETADYIRAMQMHERRGINLAEASTVGLGSVCRRGSEKPIIEIVETIQSYARNRYGRPLRLHGFGMNIRALRKCAHLLASSDSLAWSRGARDDHIRLPGCTHQSRYCNNCPDYALQWYGKVRAAVEEPKQLAFDLIA